MAQVDALTPQQIKEFCLRLLAQREHSQQELLQKMQRKGLRPPQVLPILHELAVEGWQSDQRFAENYARQRLAKGYGWQRVEFELRQRGISDLDALRRELSRDDLTDLWQVYLKKYGDKVVTNYAEWSKRSRFLQQRGFSRAMINALYQQLQVKS